MEVIKLRLRDLRRPEQAPGLYDLSRSPVRVGRGPRCEIRLHTNEIADVQVILRREADHWQLHPVGPAKGCQTALGWLNEAVVLTSGFRFEIGQVEFEFDPTPDIKKSLVTSSPIELRLDEIDSANKSTPSLAESQPLKLPEAIVSHPQVVVENKFALVKTPQSPMVPLDLAATALKTGDYPALRVAGAASAASVSLADSTAISDSFVRRVRKEMKLAGTRLVESNLATPSSRKLNLLKSGSGSRPVGESFSPESPRPVPATSVLRRHKQHETKSSDSLHQTLNQWAADYSRRNVLKSDLPQKNILDQTGFPENEITAKNLSLVNRKRLKSDEIADLISFDAGNEPESQAKELPKPPSPVVFSVVESANTAEILLNEGTNGIVAQATTATVGIEDSDLYQPEFETDDFFFQPDPLLLSEIHSEEEAIDQNKIDSCLKDVDVEDDTFEAMVDLTSLGMADLTQVKDSGNSQITNLIPEFEQWLENVGPILEDFQHFNESGSIPPMAEQGSQDSIMVADLATEIEPASVEMLVQTSVESEAQTDQPSAEFILPDFVEPLAELTAHVSPVNEINHRQNESISDEMQSDETSSEFRSQAEESEINGWPSVGDIMRWSASRDSSMMDGPSAFPVPRSDQSVESLEPAGFLKMNLPLALFVSTGISVATLAAGYLSYRMGVQDELTQKAVSAVIASARSEQPPRIASGTLKKMGENRSWWELPADQIWWRASLMKQREEGGLDVSQSSEVMAQLAGQASPVLSTARLWKLTRYPELTKAADWNNLSREVLTLVTTADHFRRIGEHDRAKTADKMALEMVTRSDMIFDRDRLHFDSELGTNRFLLPGQFDALVILKRLLKEADAYNLIIAVMPENRPEVWLTAAELIERNGLGDPLPLYTRILDLEKGIPAGTSQRQRLHQAVLAEAQAQTARISQSIETYQAIVAKTPENDLRRSWFYNLGELSNRQQDRNAAAGYWRKARSVNPNHEVDRHAIAASRSLQTGTTAPEMTSTTLRTN